MPQKRKSVTESVFFRNEQLIANFNFHRQPEKYIDATSMKNTDPQNSIMIKEESFLWHLPCMIDLRSLWIRKEIKDFILMYI